MMPGSSLWTTVESLFPRGFRLEGEAEDELEGGLGIEEGFKIRAGMGSKSESGSESDAKSVPENADTELAFRQTRRRAQAREQKNPCDHPKGERICGRRIDIRE